MKWNSSFACFVPFQWSWASKNWLAWNSRKDMSAVNSIENTYSISWIRRRKAAQETTANSQTGIYHFCYGFEQFEKKFKNSKYKIVKISEPFKSQDQISISSYWTWRHSLTDISLSILHNFLQDEKVELQGEVENKSMFGFLQTDTNDWIMPHRGSKVALWR